MNRSVCCLLGCVALLALRPAVRAQVTLSLSSPTQNTAAGGSLTYCGTLVNTSTTAMVDLNDISFAITSGDGGSVVFSDNTYFANVPGILLPGETYTGPIFSLTLTSDAEPTDYIGTVTIIGGADIFAADNLVAASFTALSPSVSIAAADASASEYGPTSGSFTLSRTGSTGSPLAVSFTLTGTAVNGTSYQFVAAPATIAAGAATASVTITPIQDAIAEGDRSIILTLAASSAYNLGSPAAATMTEHDEPIDQWRLNTFGAAANTPAAADLAEWNGDGIPNLVAYALGLNPLSPNDALLPASSTSSGYLAISFVPSATAIDITYVVEASTDLVTWSATNVTPVIVSNPNPPNLLTYEYAAPIGIIPQLFLRLSVTRTETP